MTATHASTETGSLAATTRRVRLTTAHRTAVGLTAVTGALHLYLYVTEDWLPFLLAGAGFLGALALFVVLQTHRRPLYAAGVLFTAAQVVGYLLFPMGPFWLGVADKAVQVALVATLGYLFLVDDRHSPAVAAEPAAAPEGGAVR